MIRRLIAATLLFSGAAIANAGFVAWWFDREVTDPERVREMAAAVLRSPEIRAEIAPMLLDQATAELQLADTDIAALTDAAETTLLDPAYILNYADSLEGIYRSIFETGEPACIGFETDELEQGLLEQLAVVNPQLAETVANIDLPASIDFQIDSLPDLAALENGLGTGWRIALWVGGALLVAGVVIHPRSAVAVRRVGILFLGFAGLQALAVWLITDWAAPNLPLGEFEALTSATAGIILASLTAQAIVQAVAAGTLAVTAHLAIWVPRMVAPWRAVTATIGG